jgi:hypothetical protein
MARRSFVLGKIDRSHSVDSTQIDFICLQTSCLTSFLIFSFFSPPQVSWIRKRDLHIMTIGILTYTNDQRYQALHTEGSDEWAMRIASAQPRDSGVFECQVSTEPKISQAYRLNVVGK